jgi:hypothetical protein
MSFLIIPPFEIDADGEFERASEGTYFDQFGVLQTAAIDEPRFDHDPATGEFRGLLIEPSATNLWFPSTYTPANGVGADVVVTEGFTAPDNTTTASSVKGSAASSGLYGVGNRLQSVVTTSIATAVCGSVFIKAVTASAYSTYFFLRDFTSAVQIRLNLSFDASGALTLTGTTNTGSPTNPQSGIQDCGNGWYRVWASFTAATTGEAQYSLICHAGTVAGNETAYWGAQLEEGSRPSSYIATAGSQVTRAADSVPGLVSNVPETDYPEWDVATGYDLGERVIVISDNGSPEVFYHNVYESLIAGTGTNTGNDPTLDPQWPDGEPVNWILVGSTNRWKMFDDKNSSQTVNADSIDVAITVTSRPTSLFLGNVECQRIEVCQKGADGTIYYQNSFEMIENSGEPSYYNWLFQQIRKRTDLLIGDLVPLSGGTISIRLINTGGTVKCGTCLIGYAEEIGGTQYGAGVGIQDFSVKQQNDFGDYQILERAYSREGDFTVMVDNGNIDRVQNLLASRRAKPTLYIGTELYRCTYIYGFFSDMSNVITYPQQSLLNINIKGLT